MVAEGVEAEEQVFILKDKRCVATQGYLFGKPLPAETLTRLLAKSRLLASQKRRMPSSDAA